MSFRGEHVEVRNLQQNVSVNSIFYNLFSPEFRATVVNCNLQTPNDFAATCCGFPDIPGIPDIQISVTESDMNLVLTKTRSQIIPDGSLQSKQEKAHCRLEFIKHN